MSISTSELGRLEYTRHEMFVLRYSELGRSIPVEENTRRIMLAERLITETPRENVYRLTDRGRLACDILRKQIEQSVDL